MVNKAGRRDRIRILYVIASSDMGGAENFVYTFLKYLDNSRFEKYVICPDRGYYTEKFKSLTKEALLISPKRSFMNPAVIFRAARFIRKNKIDLIHTMLYTSDFCGIAAKLFSGRARILNTINGFNFLVLKNEGLQLKKKIASLLYRFIYRYSDRLAAVSEAVREDLLKRRGVKIKPNKIEVVLAAGIEDSYDNFSDYDVKRFRSKYVRQGKLIVTAIGALNEIKDYDTMLKAFAMAAKKNSDMTLCIAGDGPEKERLRRKAFELGIAEKTFFLGIVEKAERDALLSLTDIFIMSSISEGCPTALIEAMYFGRPVIATRVGGIPEIIENNKTGILVPPQDPGILSDAIVDLAADKETRTRLGKTVKQIFEERFTMRHVTEAYEAIYEKIV